MTVLHSGSTKKFSAGWETIFAKGAKKKSAVPTKAAKPSPKKSATKKKPAPKKAKK